MERNYNSGSRGGGFGPKPPVREGEVLEVEIEAVGEKGDGIARKDGFVLFVPGVKEGDRVKVKVTRVLRKVGFAEVFREGAEEAPAEEVSRKEAPVEEAPAEEPEPEAPAEDTEDFGEEVTEEASVEETVEAAPEEEPEAAPEEELEAPEPPEEEEKTE